MIIQSCLFLGLLPWCREGWMAKSGIYLFIYLFICLLIYLFIYLFYHLFIPLFFQKTLPFILGVKYFCSTRFLLLKTSFLFSEAVISSLFLTQQLISQLWPFVSKMVGDILKNSVEPEIKKALPSVIKSFHFVDVDLGNKVSSWHIYSVLHVCLPGLEIAEQKIKKVEVATTVWCEVLAIWERKWCLPALNNFAFEKFFCNINQKLDLLPRKSFKLFFVLI